MIVGDVRKKAGEVWRMLEDILAIFAWKGGRKHTQIEKGWTYCETVAVVVNQMKASFIRLQTHRILTGAGVEVKHLTVSSSETLVGMGELLLFSPSSKR